LKIENCNNINKGKVMKKIMLTCVMAILSLSLTNAKQNYDDEDDDFEEDEKVQTIFLGFSVGLNQNN